jgi:predicted MFS family arabinose efflux permease
VLPLLLVFVVGTFGLNFQLTLALMTREAFGRGAAAYGLLSTALATGSLVGALASTRRTTRPRQRMLLGTAVVFGVVEVLVGLMPTYETLLVLLVPAGAAALTFVIAANSSVQLGSDAAVRGRVMALYLMCFMGGTLFGAPLIGALSDALGPRAGLLGGGAVCALAAVVLGVLFARRRGLRVVEQVAAAVPHLAHRTEAMSHPR